jgi:hypothetical protein
MTLHPSEGRVYTAENGLYPSDIERYDLLPGGAIVRAWDSPYFSEHRMGGNVWASPAGDRLVSRGGDVFTAGATRAEDMLYVQGLSTGSITEVAWDGPSRIVFTLEGEAVHYYNTTSGLEIGSFATKGAGSFIGINDNQLYVTVPTGTGTTVYSFPHPAPGASTNTPPTARFTVSPDTGRTTRTDLVFDASASSDAEDRTSALQFRWDLGNDGTWDTPFQSSPSLIHRYNTAGTKTVRLQVRDHLALVGDLVQSFDVTFEPDPGTRGPNHPAFVLPFALTDAVFDPVRPYLYVSQKQSKKVYFVNLLTGLIDREFSFAYMPESLTIAPDGSRLYVALMTREHDSYWQIADQEGFFASIDLATHMKDREFFIPIDPYDMVVTSNGWLMVSSGSGQWTTLRVYDAATGERTGEAPIRQQSHLALHPSEAMVYSADTDSIPSDITRYDVLLGGFQYWVGSPYHGEHRMDGNVWVSPLGDQLVTHGGDVYDAADMVYIGGLSVGPITQVVWDAPGNLIFTLEGDVVRYCSRFSRREVGALPRGDVGSFLGIHDGRIYVTIPEGTVTRIDSFDHPLPGGIVETPPLAHFSINPSANCTTQTNVMFDASSSTDAEDPFSTLQFRWDFDNDGTWDTPFQSFPKGAHRYLSPGTKFVRLQVRDPETLIGDWVSSVTIAFAPDPGAPGPAHTPFVLPFSVADAAFDPLRPYVYVSSKTAKKVYFVNLQSGLIEREYAFDLMPETLALAPDASTLYVALLTREHSPSYLDGTHESWIGKFNLTSRVKEVEFNIPEDPYDMLATSDGHLVVSSGSGTRKHLRVFDVNTHQQTGLALHTGTRMRLALHPSETKLYAAALDISPTYFERYDLLPGGGIERRSDLPHNGQPRVNGNVYASPLGDKLVTRGGEVYTTSEAGGEDMSDLSRLAVNFIEALAWDPVYSMIVTAEASTVHVYDLATLAPRAIYPLSGAGNFVGVRNGDVYAFVPSGSVTNIQVFPRQSVAPEHASRRAVIQP